MIVRQWFRYTSKSGPRFISRDDSEKIIDLDGYPDHLLILHFLILQIKKIYPLLGLQIS